MAVQLPTDIQGAAAGVLVYTFVCLFCSIALYAACWARGEPYSYIALLALSTGLSSTSSIVQQINTVVWWTDLLLAHRQRVLENLTNPELILTGSSTGANLVLFYIQYYAFNVESIVLSCWAVELAIGVLHIRPKRSHLCGVVSKVLAFVLPAVLIGLVRSSAVQRNAVVFLLISNAIMAIGIAIGCFAVLFILARYIVTRRALSSIRPPESGVSSISDVSYRKYDKGLIIRFAITFFGSSALELAMILIQISIAAKTESALHETRLSTEDAKLYFVLFMPGVTAGLLCFVVFGTTKSYRNHLLRILPDIRRRGPIPSRADNHGHGRGMEAESRIV